MRVVVGVVVLAVIAGCGTVDGSTNTRATNQPTTRATTQPTTSTESADGGSTEPGSTDGPPPVVVRANGETLSIAPCGFCWMPLDGTAGVCTDAQQPTDLPQLGAVTGPVEVELPADGWTFSATLATPGEHCALSITDELVATGPRSWTLAPTGPAQAYDVWLFGRGPEGDVSVGFAMTTTADGELPAPSADLGLFFEDDGEVLATGPVSVGVAGLPRTPAQAAATVTVVGSDGTATALALAVEASGCDVLGSVSLAEPGAGVSGTEVETTFGPAPYAVAVALVLDGVTHVAELAWPVDDLPVGEWAVPLDLTPPLPQATPDDYRDAG